MNGTFLLHVLNSDMRKPFYISFLVVASITLTLIGLRVFYAPKKLPATHKKVLARVDNEYLYAEDIPGSIDDRSTSDAVSSHYQKWRQRYIKQWVADKLLHRKAQQHVVGEQRKTIAKQVSDFETALLEHTYLQQLIEQQLNLEISEEEVQAYYQTHAENFKLKESIFRGKLVILPKRVPQIGKVKQLLKQQEDVAAITELQEYCAQNATYYLLDNSNWFKWNDLVAQTSAKKTLHYALEKVPSFKKPYLKEIQDYEAYYYLQIEDYKPINDIAPLELVRDQIHKIILHNRKITLANTVREHIVAQATPNKDYTIYDDENEN